MTWNTFLTLTILLLCLQEQFVGVFGDFRIVDKWTNKVVFQTSSDFVRTGCGTFLEKSYVVASDPLDACDIPAAPPARSLISCVFGGSQDNGRHHWVLLAQDGGCDLKTKFRNAATAGYSGIIVGTDERHEEIIHPGLLSEDDEEFIDVHLVHSMDIRVLSKRFGQGILDNVFVEPPGLSRCRDEYHKTWLRSRYVSLFIRSWKAIMGKHVTLQSSWSHFFFYLSLSLTFITKRIVFSDTCWHCILWTLVVFGRVAKGLKTVVPSVFFIRDTYSSIALSLASIVFSITAMMIISIHNNAQKVLKYKSFQERRSSCCESEPAKPKPQPQPSTPSQPPPPRPSNQERYSSDYTFRHRINLNISLTEPLTKAKVNMAYRDMALKYHPDKNNHLDERLMAKITDEFRSKKKSRDILLLFCRE